MRILLLITLLFILGCTQKPTNYLAKFRQNSIINTQRDEFINKNVRFLVLTSYISEIDSNLTLKGHDEFIVAIYKNDLKKENQALSNISLNGRIDNISVTHLEKNDPRRELSPIKNKWVHYFLIQAPQVHKKTLKLNYEIDHSILVESKFPKDF